MIERAICKPRYWNLGIRIGTGIGTDITNAIFPVSQDLWTRNFAGC